MAECEHWYSLTCHLGNALESVGSAASDAIIGTWAGAILEGLDKALITVGTFWVGTAGRVCSIASTFSIA